MQISEPASECPFRRLRQLRRADPAADAAHRDDALRLERHRGDDERGATRARVHGPGRDPQVRRLLSRPRRLVSGSCRLGGGDAGFAGFSGSSGRARGSHADIAVQRSRRRRETGARQPAWSGGNHRRACCRQRGVHSARSWVSCRDCGRSPTARARFSSSTKS